MAVGPNGEAYAVVEGRLYAASPSTVTVANPSLATAPPPAPTSNPRPAPTPPRAAGAGLGYDQAGDVDSAPFPWPSLFFMLAFGSVAVALAPIVWSGRTPPTRSLR